MKKRIIYLDYLRFIASLAVIGIHVSGKGTYVLGNALDANSSIFTIAATIDSCLRFAVPIFFMISGALVFLKSEMDIPTFYYQRAKRIIIPLLFWALFYSFAFNKGYSLQEHIKQVLLGNAFYHLWFLYAVIGLYLIAPVFYQFLKHSSKKDIEIILGISLVLNALLPIIGEKFWVDLGPALNLNYLTGGIFYFILGYYLINFDLKILNRIPILLAGYLISTILIVFGTLKGSFNQGSYVTFYVNIFWILTIIQSVSIFCLVKTLCFNVSEGNSSFFKIVNKLGAYFMGIYLIHAFVLEVYQRIVQIDYYTVGILPYLLHLVVGVLVSYLGAIAITFCIKRVPLLKNIV